MIKMIIMIIIMTMIAIMTMMAIQREGESVKYIVCSILH